MFTTQWCERLAVPAFALLFPHLPVKSKCSEFAQEAPLQGVPGLCECGLSC